MLASPTCRRRRSARAGSRRPCACPKRHRQNAAARETHSTYAHTLSATTSLLRRRRKTAPCKLQHEQEHQSGQVPSKSKCALNTQFMLLPNCTLACLPSPSCKKPPACRCLRALLLWAATHDPARTHTAHLGDTALNQWRGQRHGHQPAAEYVIACCRKHFRNVVCRLHTHRASHNCANVAPGTAYEALPPGFPGTARA